MTAASVTHEAFDPIRTLRHMGRTALDASRQWTMREWAGRLAARAPPHDYVAQLRELYSGIVSRMRYVQEPEEWIYGTGRSLLAHGLGAAYNRGPTCPSPEHCDVEGTPWRERGFGDCDDMATLAAAGALSLGMPKVLFRVARSPGWAHVSVTAQTPTGRWVELDPVAWPRHARRGEAPGFDWAVSGSGIEVAHFDLEGEPAASPHKGGRDMWAVPASGYGQYGRIYDQGFGAVPVEAGAPWRTYYAGIVEPNNDGNYDVGPIESSDREGHLVLVGPDDDLGPRVVAMPHYHADLFRRGMTLDGAPGVTQFGEEVRYSSDLDAWVPAETHEPAEDGEVAEAWDPGTFGSRADRLRRRAARRAARKVRRGRRRDKLRRGWLRFRRGVRRVFRKVVGAVKKVGKLVRRVAGKLLNSKIVQRILARTISMFGVPAAIGRRIIAVAGKFIEQGGLFKLFRMLRKDPKGALRMLASSVAAAVSSPVLRSLPAHFAEGFGAFGPIDPDDGEMPGTIDEPYVAHNDGCYEVEQDDGQVYHAQPVAALTGLPGVADFGALDITAEPTPGHWYQVRQGDNLLDVAEKAYGTKGGETIKRAQWIARAQTNQPYRRDPKGEFEGKYFKDGLPSFKAKFRCNPGAMVEIGGTGNCYATLWIPPAEGVEAPADAPPVPPGPVDPVPPPAPDVPPKPDIPVPPPKPNPQPPPKPVPPCNTPGCGGGAPPMPPQPPQPQAGGAGMLFPFVLLALASAS